jgi:hypothetical protein
MRHRYRSLAILAGLLALLPSVGFGLLYIGDNAPNFTLPDTAYINHQLTEWSGRCVMLNFWQSG